MKLIAQLCLLLAHNGHESISDAGQGIAMVLLLGLISGSENISIVIVVYWWSVGYDSGTNCFVHLRLRRNQDGENFIWYGNRESRLHFHDTIHVKNHINFGLNS